MKTKNMKPICRRILVMHSRAITQLVEIRNRNHCRKFSNMAAILGRAHRAGATCQKGLSA
ncbi:MAG: hypothetical protein ACPGVU_11855 [Limisphaerales bacterium]